MERDENPISNVSKCARLLSLTIFVLMIASFIFHLCAFGDLLFKDVDSQTDIQKNKTEKKLDDLFDLNLPFFCIFAHLIWTIVSMVVLDQYNLLNNPSICRIIFKLFVCTCPLLLCSELSLIFVCHIQFLTNDLLMIMVKWLIFIATILICFWTGILSDKKKWRGIHGGKIAPELYSTLYQFQN